MFLYSVYDDLTEEFSAPFMVKNDKLAIHGFENDLANIAEQSVRRRTGIDVSNYTLYKIAEFDTENLLYPLKVLDQRVIYQGRDFDLTEYLELLEQAKKHDAFDITDALKQEIEGDK